MRTAVLRHDRHAHPEALARGRLSGIGERVECQVHLGEHAEIDVLAGVGTEVAAVEACAEQHVVHERGDAAGLPPIAISPNTGRFLQVLVAARGARRILEIGTLGGYSTLWLAKALPPDGHLITLEHDPRHAEVARANLDAGGVGELVEIRVGRALDSLAALKDEGADPFDLVFIDADKESYPQYLDFSLRLTRSGSLIVADNVVRGGAILDADSDSRARGTRRFLEVLASDERVEATVLQTVGEKGYDGLAIARVR
jgi:predicted O-methyltransferase YrrM